MRTALLAAAGLSALAVLVGTILFLRVGVTSVTVQPPEAGRSATLEIAEGWGFVRGGRVRSVSRRVLLRVEAPGFHSEEVELGSANRSGFAEVTMRRIKTVIRARTDPPVRGTRWQVGEEDAGSGPAIEVEVEPGRHVVTVRGPGHEPATAEVELERGEEADLTLELAEATASLAITSDPPGASVAVGGVPRGTTPASLELPLGSHRVSLSLEGFEPVEDEVVLAGEAPVAREYVLSPVGASVSFRLSPPGGTLVLDGRLVPSPEGVEVEPLAPHRATYSKEGHAEAEVEFRLEPGEHADIELSLEELFGDVVVISTPEAEVSVDGSPAGTTPLSLRLSAVEHTVVLTREGHETVTRRITPDPGAPARIEATLRSEREAKLATAPESYTNGAGIQLVLFRKPGTVEMGSERGEEGRRGNEFRRSVALSRAFYAAVHETTAGQYAAFSGKAPGGGKDLPAVNVSWAEALAFCNWLSGKEGLKPFYRVEGGRYLGIDRDADGYRLPTEAEWEWLARKAGRAQQTEFPWGKSRKVPPKSGNMADESAKGSVRVYVPNYTDGFQGPAPVGSFKANPAGIHDLAGNVSEWIHDAYVHVPPDGSPEEDPIDDAMDAAHVVKGSSWRSGSLTELRAAYRESAVAGKETLGFRVVRYLHGESHASGR